MTADRLTSHCSLHATVNTDVTREALEPVSAELGGLRGVRQLAAGRLYPHGFHTGPDARHVPISTTDVFTEVASRCALNSTL